LKDGQLLLVVLLCLNVCHLCLQCNMIFMSKIKMLVF
jgi:hypothetical protein